MEEWRPGVLLDHEPLVGRAGRTWRGTFEIHIDLGEQRQIPKVRDLSGEIETSSSGE
jgi:hypothetical protein